MSGTTHEPGDDFEAAKAVFEKLRDLSRERQERVLRWVAEGLGVANPGAVQPASSQAGTGQKEVADRLPSQASGTPGVTDIKSFIAAKSPKSDQQFATAVAYYYRFEAPPAQRKETISTATLQEAARLSGRKRLTNPNSTLNNARNQGYIDNAGRGEFSINTVGENLVAMALPGGVGPSVVPAAGRKGSKARKGPKKK